MSDTKRWREQALHQLDTLSGRVHALAAARDPRAPMYRVRIAELRLLVERFATRSVR